MEFAPLSIDLSHFDNALKPDGSQIYDLIIVGGGPAAMTAALYAARKTLNVALIARNFGGNVQNTSEVENYMGFQTIQGQELAGKFIDHVKKFQVPLAEGENVREIGKSHDLFQTVMEDGRVFQSKSVIFATGTRHRHLDVPGEEAFLGRGVAYCATCDAPFFKDKQVVVVGGGNSGFTAALDLMKLASHVTLLNRSRGWKADEVLVQRVKNAPHVTLLDYHLVHRIEGGQKVEQVTIYNRETEKESQVQADGIFIEIGLIPNADPVKNLAALSDLGKVKVDCHCRTNVPGLFAAGDVTTVPYDQIIISAGEGAKAALSAADYLSRLS